MLNFTQFVLLTVAILLLMIILFFLTGIIYNQNGDVSVIEKKKKFYKLESRRYAYYLPLLYKKVYSYPVKTFKGYTVNHKKVYLLAKNPMLLYKEHINLKKFIKNEDYLKLAKKYQLIIRHD